MSPRPSPPARRRSLPAGLAALLAASAIAACGRPQSQDAGPWLTEAEEHLAAGDHRSALIAAQRAFKHHPDDLEVRGLLAEVYLRAGQPSSAELHLRKALQLGGEPDRLLPALGEALRRQGESRRIVDELETDAVAGEDARASVLALRVNALLSLGEVEAARAGIESLERLAPTHPALPGARATLALAEGDLERSLDLIDEALRRFPDSPHVHVTRGRLLMARRDLAGAEAAFSRAATLADRIGDPVVWNGARAGRVHALSAQGRHEQAVRTAHEFVAADPGGAFPRFVLAQALHHAGEHREAADMLRELAANTEPSAPIYLVWAQASIAQGQYGSAEAFLATALRLDPGNVDARRLLMAVKLRNREGRVDADVVSEVMEDLGDDAAALELLGLASLADARLEQGIGFLERALEHNPQDAGIRLSLAAARLAAGEAKAARGLLEPLSPGAGGNYRRERLLMLSHLREGDPDTAAGLARALAADHPDDPAAHRLAAEILVRVGDLPGAEGQLERVLELAPRDLRALVGLARLAAAQDRPAEAHERFSQALTHEPDNLPALIGMAAVAEMQGKSRETLRWLERARAAGRDRPQIVLALARRYAEAGERERALTLLEAVPATALEAAPGLMVAVSDLRWRLGRRERALGGLRRAVEIAPDWAFGHFVLAKAYLELGETDQARAALRRVLELEPSHVGAAYRLAPLALRAGDRDEAFGLARRLQADPATRADGLALEGRLLALDGEPGRGVGLLEQAMALRSDREDAIAASEILLEAGEPRALRHLRAWIADHPDDAKAWTWLAILTQRAGHGERAARAYEKALALEPGGAVALNNLAYLYLEAGDGRALETARRAREASPGDPAVADTLGWALVDQGRAAEAIPLLREAAQGLPGVPEVRYHLAVALARSGETEEAGRILETLLAAEGDFEGREQARRLLASLR